jgi:8-oxo-dGTP pyrophosphatase MutT (NUDIX family)/precorrin-6B methylase 2
MIGDEKRTLAFKKAIEKCVKRNDVVADVGCGTGILSFFALKAGARKVYAIERTGIIELAKKISERNKFNGIEFVNADSADVELPKKCDVIVSECIGYFALQENMITDVLNFREKNLKKDGIIVPNKIGLFLSLVKSKKAYEEVDFWKRRYGIDFLPVRNFSANSTYHIEINKNDLLSKPVLVKEINLLHDKKIDFNESITLKAEGDGTAYGLCGYFNAALCKGVTLSNHPGSKTHWNQEFFPFKKTLKLRKNQEIKVKIKADLKRAFVDWYWEVSNIPHSTKYGMRIKDQKSCDVVAFILLKNGKVLVEERMPNRKIDPGKIVIPGGHVKRGESLIDACKRELKEELNVDSSDLEFVCRFLHGVGSEIQMIHYFLCKDWKGRMKTREAKRIVWLDKKNLNKLSYEIDRKAINKIKSFCFRCF